MEMSKMMTARINSMRYSASAPNKGSTFSFSLPLAAYVKMFRMVKIEKPEQSNYTHLDDEAKDHDV
jgi:hypothetical protein